MFQINLDKLTPFDTQVITLINLAPDKWAMRAPQALCYHDDFGWFRSSLLGLGAQSTSNLTNKARRLSWRGQILLRQKIREILRSAVDPSIPVTTATTVGGALTPTPIGVGGTAAAAGGAASPVSATAIQAMQARSQATLQAQVNNFYRELLNSSAVPNVFGSMGNMYSAAPPKDIDSVYGILMNQQRAKLSPQELAEFKKNLPSQAAIGSLLKPGPIV